MGRLFIPEHRYKGDSNRWHCWTGLQETSDYSPQWQWEIPSKWRFLARKIIYTQGTVEDLQGQARGCREGCSHRVHAVVRTGGQSGAWQGQPSPRDDGSPKPGGICLSSPQIHLIRRSSGRPTEATNRYRNSGQRWLQSRPEWPSVTWMENHRHAWRILNYALPCGHGSESFKIIPCNHQD